MSLLATGAKTVRRFTLTAAPLAMSMALFATPAVGQIPDIVRMAPADTEVFIGTANLGDLNKQFDQLLTAIEMKNMFPFKPTNIFDEMGMEASTLDQSRPAGIALLKGIFNQAGGMHPSPPILLFLPVENYGQWLAAIDPAAGADGVAQIDMGDIDNPGYCRQVGSYAVVGPSKEHVQAYAPGDTTDANHISNRIGSVGADLASTCQLYALVDFSNLSEMRDVIIAGATEGIEQSMGPMAAMGGGMQPEQMSAMTEAFVNLFFDEASTAAVGVRVSSRGLAFDLAVQTKDGSEVGAMLPGGDEPRNLLSHFADAPFMLAMSWDTRAIKLAGLADLLEKRLNLSALQGGNASPTPNVWRESDGMGMVMYPSPGGMAGGMLTKSISLFTGNSEKLMSAMQEATQATDGMEQNGILFSSTYTENAQEIAGHSADTYSIKMQFPPEMQQMMMMSMQMMYGSAGAPEGFVVPVEGGIIQTLSRNSQVVEQMIAVQNGEGANLGDNRVLAAADELLPRHAMMRTYIGLGTIADQVGPLLQMFVQGIDMKELGALPPLAVSMSASKGGLLSSFAIPAPVLKTAAEIAQQFGPMGGGDAGGAEEPPLF